MPEVGVWVVRILAVLLVAVLVNVAYWVVLPAYRVEVPAWLVICFNVAFIVPLFWALPSAGGKMGEYPGVDESSERLRRVGWPVGEAGGRDSFSEDPSEG
jgi:hypothetical protein